MVKPPQYRAVRPRRPVRVPRVIHTGDPFRLGRRFYLDGRGLYRVFNAAVYRFYRSNTGPPLESETPYATNATLPHEPTDTFADGTWYLSVDRFNGVLSSGFLPLGPNGETYLRLDIDFEAVTGSPPNGPNDWQLIEKPGGVVRILGFYYQSDALRAGEWAIAYTTDGSTPAADSPDVTVTIAALGISVLDYDLPAQSPGTQLAVRVQTRRNDGTVPSPSWVYSEDSDVLRVDIDTGGPSVPIGGEIWPGPIPEEA